MMPLSNVLALLPRLDAAGKETRFHGLKFSWGFDQFVKLSTFNDARHGFLLDDSCVFGAEVFVRKERSRGTGELLSMIKQPDTFKYTWKIKNFSKLDEKRQESEIFSMADQKWKIVLYPKGKGRGMGTHLSLYLALDLATLPTGYRLYTEYTLRILNQFWGRESDRYVKAKHWFDAASSETGGPRFISQDIIYQPNGSYVVKDTCIVEAKVTVLGIVSAF